MLLINEERGVEGIIFTPDETQKPAGIVVEIPTMNQPLYYGAGDVREETDRVDRVTATVYGIIIHKASGEELVAPVNLSGKYEAKIYQFGDDKHYWLWKKDGEKTTITPYLN